jgi:hypothetical protein
LRQRVEKAAQWMTGRSPSQAECQFLSAYFGPSFDPPGLRIVASLGRRSWSPFGHRISLVRSHFRGGNAAGEVELNDPRSASVFAHEAMHVWQRQGGRRVTWEAIPLQASYTLAGIDPYRYERCEDPSRMLERFLKANVEQQAKMFEDFVFFDQTGRDTSAFAELACHVRGRRLG